MTHLLDTNACIAVMRGNLKLQQELVARHPNDLAVSMITVFELFSGVALCKKPENEGQKVDLFLEPVHVLPFDLVPSKKAADVRAFLQRRGEMIGPFDLLIGAHALAMELTLVTHNSKEFSRIPGLKLDDWQ